MIVRLLAPLAALLVLAACNATTDRDLADQHSLAEAKPVGEAVSCIPLQQIDNTRIRDERTIDFELKGRRIFRNTLPGDCPGLRFNESFSYSTSLPSLCSVDLIRVYRAGAGPDGPTCQLGEFQEIELPGRSTLR